ARRRPASRTLRFSSACSSPTSVGSSSCIAAASRYSAKYSGSTPHARATSSIARIEGLSCPLTRMLMWAWVMPLPSSARVLWASPSVSASRGSPGPSCPPAASPSSILPQRVGLLGVERQADVAEVAAKWSQPDGSTDRFRAQGVLDRREHLGLCLEHLIADRIFERLVGEIDQSQPLEVVDVRRNALT